MTKSFFVAQSVKELNFIIENVDEKLICIPINLETYLYCMQKNIKFLDPINYIKKEFHKKSILASGRLVKKLNLSEKNLIGVLKKRYIGIIRKFFHSSVFIYELINNISRKKSINKIYISGWNSYSFTETTNNYFVSEIIENLFSKLNIINLSAKDKKREVTSNCNYTYKIEHLRKKISKYILLNDLGYNFKRIYFWALKNNYKIAVIVTQKIGFLKRLFFSVVGIELILLIKEKAEKTKSLKKLKKINFKHNKVDYSKLLNYRKIQTIPYLNQVKEQFSPVKNFIKNNKPSFLLFNNVRGINNYCAQLSHSMKFPSVCIPHGTITKAYNKYDKIYKKTIAEEVFDGDFKFYLVQSKIFKKSLATHKVKGKTIETGNIIFAEAKKNIEKKYILYAVTMKDVANMQLYGVEFYYEFFQNLKLFNKLANSKKLDFLIKLHPTIYSCKSMLDSTFPNLEFSTDKIEKVLEKTILTISFSSTTIEDSIQSKVPVILFDQWKRYKHCESEKNSKKINKPIYYVTNEKNLINSINSIKKSNKISFEKVSLGAGCKENINQMFNYLR